MVGFGRFLAAGLVGLCLGGCSQTGPGATTGAVTGAVVGGVAGAAVGDGRPAAIVAGAAVGGLVGGAIGRDLDAGGQRAARDAEFRALEFGRAGTPVSWHNGRNSGEVVPGAMYRVNTYDCRDYAHTIYVNGQKQTARGTACRQPDGSWAAVT